MPEKIAVLCSDIHLSHKPPLARSGEPDWYEAMKRPLSELKDMADYDLPVICAGDVFDKWKSPPELINFALSMLPEGMYSIAGQHDLPYHSWEERNKSAFWTLVKSEKIEILDEGEGGMGLANSIGIRGFSWGKELSNEGVDRWTERSKLLVAHQYVWMTGCGHPGYVSEKNELPRIYPALRGYDVALFGDNHKGFYVSDKKCKVFNAGTLMRRHVDEADYRPMAGWLLEDGTVDIYYLDTSQDVFEASDLVRQAENVELQLEEFLHELQQVGAKGIDFRRAVEEAMNSKQVSRAVRRIVLEAIEGEEK